MRLLRGQDQLLVGVGCGYGAGVFVLELGGVQVWEKLVDVVKQITFTSCNLSGD